ncbi:MAG: protease inhibitor I42 family protein [Gordonibacter sp.]
MKKYLKVAIVGTCMVAILILTTGCSAPTQDSPSKENTVEFDGGTLSYAQGDLAVKVVGNATTGYEWTSEIEGSSAVAKGDEYVSEEGSKAEVGKGGVHTFRYAAEGSGEATITLKYARSWEASSDDKTVVIKATADNGAFTKAVVE